MALSSPKPYVYSVSGKAGYRIVPCHPARWTQTIHRVPFIEVYLQSGQSSANKAWGRQRMEGPCSWKLQKES